MREISTPLTLAACKALGRKLGASMPGEANLEECQQQLEELLEREPTEEEAAVFLFAWANE